MLRLSHPAACRILVPQLGIEPASPALHGGFLTTEARGKSPDFLIFKERMAVLILQVKSILLFQFWKTLDGRNKENLWLVGSQLATYKFAFVAEAVGAHPPWLLGVVTILNGLVFAMCLWGASRANSAHTDARLEVCPSPGNLQCVAQDLVCKYAIILASQECLEIRVGKYLPIKDQI